MKTGRRLGVLTIAVSGLLVAGLLFSAPAFAWDTKIKRLETSCPPGSDKARVELALELFEKGHSGHVDVSYTIGDVTSQGPQQDFGPDDQLVQVEFPVQSPAEDTTIEVHTKTFFDDSDHTPESSAEADLRQCQEEESDTTKSTEAPTTNVEAPGGAETPTTVLPPTTLAPEVAVPRLPRTGSNAVPMLIAALVLLVAGGAALFATRVRGRHAR